MAKKKAFALRLDPEVLKAVEKWASDEFRSTNGQLEWIIVNALQKEKRYKRKLAENQSAESQSAEGQSTESQSTDDQN